MKLPELKNEPSKHPAANVRFSLPNGESVPAHAHVTEVARIDKRFIDCGGTRRSESFCRLQTWFADDLDHRLTAGKLLKILNMAAPLLESEDLEVDVEHEVGFISQFPVASVQFMNDEIILLLTTRHTACLAWDKCKPPTPVLSDFNPLKADFKQTPSTSVCCSTKEN